MTREKPAGREEEQKAISRQAARLLLKSVGPQPDALWLPGLAAVNPAADTIGPVRDLVGEFPGTSPRPRRPEETRMGTGTGGPVVMIQLDGSHPASGCLRISKLKRLMGFFSCTYGAFCSVRRKNEVI